MKSIFACLFLIIVGVLVYGLVMRGVWENPTVKTIQANINDETKPRGTAAERARFILTQNLVERRSFALNKEQAEASSPDVGYYKEGKWYILFAPGMSIFAIPFYLAGLQYNLSQVFTYGMTSLFAILNLVFIFLISRQVLKMPYWAAILASMIFGFASTSLSYATTLYQHHAATFFFLSGFYFVYQYKVHKTWGFLWGFFVWLNYGLAICIDYPNAILMLPVMLYLLFVSLDIKKINERYKVFFRLGIIFTSIFFIAITLIHGYYNHTQFGSWKRLSGSLVGIRAIQDQKLDKKGNLDENIKELAKKKKPVGFFKETHLVNSAYELLIAPDKGIFIFSPIFIMGIGGIIYACWKITLERGILIALVGVNLFLYSSWSDPWGGWAYGPRYLIPSMAYMSIFVGLFLAETKYKIISKLLAFPLIVVSVAIAFLGALTTYAVPPKVEAVYLKSKYGFVFNIDFLTANKTGDFIYNYYLKNQYSLTEYFVIIVTSVCILFAIVLFILPIFAKKEEK